MSKKFAGKIAVVTGGSTGIGLATAKRFVQEGMEQVFITVAVKLRWMLQLPRLERTSRRFRAMCPVLRTLIVYTTR